MMPLFIILIILTEGFVTVSIQILTIRQLIPFVGHSVGVTSLIIGVFLLFLAYGYKQGGTYQTRYWETLSRNFLLASPLIGIGLAYPFLAFYFFGIKQYITGNLYYSLTIFLFTVTAPTVYLLGQTVPITMNLLKQADLKAHAFVGAIGGQVLHISTLGSFLGAVLTALLLMNWLGVGATVLINFICLGLLTALIYLFMHIGFKANIGMLLVGILVYSLNIAYEKTAFITTNHFGNYAVSPVAATDERPAGKMFMVNDAHSSFLDTNLNGFPYIELVKKILFKDLKLTQRSILIVGAGGFSLTAAGNYDNQVTYLDIDAALPEIAQKSFVNDFNGQFIAHEARAFFLGQQKTYDVIFSDVYNNMHEVPAHLLTREYFQQVKAAINPNGYALFNIVSQATLSSPYAKRIDNTIRSVFSSCMTIPVTYHEGLTNLIYTCKVTEAQANDHRIYTDDKNTASLDLMEKPLTH